MLTSLSYFLFYHLDSISPQGNDKHFESPLHTAFITVIIIRSLGSDTKLRNVLEMLEEERGGEKGELLVEAYFVFLCHFK